MEHLPENLSRQGSQAFEVVLPRGAQLLVYPSNFSSQRPAKTPQKLVKLSNKFKRLLALASAIGLLALILIACSALSPNWETMEFIIPRIIQRACNKQNPQNWTLSHVILDGSDNRLTKFNNLTRWEICHKWKNSPPKIVGVGIYNGTSMNDTIIEIYNMIGGAFQVCYERHADRGFLAFIRSMNKNGTSLCFNYLLDVRMKNFGCRQMTLKMQNNMIACVIIVFLCIVSSAIIGAVSVLARMVPAVLVNAFLYLTACVFIIFANCIEHIKLNHIQSKWGPCYPIANFTADLYDPKLIRVHYGWPIFLNWAAVAVFIAAAGAWFKLKQVLHVEASRAMI